MYKLIYSVLVNKQQPSETTNSLFTYCVSEK